MPIAPSKKDKYSSDATYFKRIMLTAEAIIQTLRENKERIDSFGVRTIGIFGSYVHGDATTESDIDIAITFQEGKKSFRHYIELLHFLEDTFNKKIELVIQDNIKEALKKHILPTIQYA